MDGILEFFYANKEAIFIIALTIFLGIEVISNVPSVLHTPLMSGANAI
ncbi:MAG: NAD(P) transhydrogenase subunit alpha, partial [Bacteroidales bacterium]|nr:NAD(P) transhydrogenase subunit alpha [Bacteroidales bacterium]